MAIKQDFTTLYYNTTFCLTSDIIADFNPASRVLGVDVTDGMGTVFTAMGTRYDINLCADEAFLTTDSHETDTRSVDRVPVNEVMKWARGEMIREGSLPEKYRVFADDVKAGAPMYEGYQAYEAGDPEAPTLFLMSPFEESPEETVKAFSKFTSGAYCTNKYGDCGYLKLQLEMIDELDDGLADVLDAYETVVTDDQFVLDALLVRFFEQREKIVFIDEFLAGRVPDAEGRIAIHESGVINRLYPLRKVDYTLLVGEPVFPARCGFDTTDSGIAGGLGLANPEALKAIAARRVKDLESLGADVIVTPCAAEAYGLKCGGGKVKTLLEFVSEL